MTARNSAASNPPPSKGFDLEMARQLFEEMGTDAEPDFSLIEQHYHQYVRFQDPIQTLEGRDALIEMSRRLIERCRELRAKVQAAAQNGNVILLQWEMEARLGPAPLMRIEGCTKLTLDGEGRVVSHRDYFDLWGDSLSSTPGLGTLYRGFMGLVG